MDVNYSRMVPVIPALQRTFYFKNWASMQEFMADMNCLIEQEKVRLLLLLLFRLMNAKMTGQL